MGARGRLVLVRHGESIANAADTFAGWADVALTPEGIREAERAGRALAAAGVRPDVVHTSVLGRAINSAHLVLDGCGAGVGRIRLHRHWRLNERHYGALQGWSKVEARQRYGAGRVERWRRSVEVGPPPLEGPALAEQLGDPRYQDPAARAVRSESLGQVRARIEPYWRETLAPEVECGLTVLVVGHGNALRMLAALATGRPAAAGASLVFPTAEPVEVAVSGALAVGVCASRA